MRIGRAIAAAAGSLAMVGMPLATASAAPTAGPSQANLASATRTQLPAPTTLKASTTCRGNNHGAYACFKSYGDKFYIKDTKDDGYAVAVVWRTDYGKKGECLDTYGYGSGWSHCDYNLREGHKISFWTVDETLYTWKYKYWSRGQTATI